MGTTTFSGPVVSGNGLTANSGGISSLAGEITSLGAIQSGTIKTTTGTTIGTDINNMGFTLMAQTAQVDILGAPTAAGGATALTTIGTLPPGAVITGFDLNVYEASDVAVSAHVVVGLNVTAASSLAAGTSASFVLTSTSVTSVTGGAPRIAHSSAMASSTINVGVNGAQVVLAYMPKNSATTAASVGAAIGTVYYLQPTVASGFYSV